MIKEVIAVTWHGVDEITDPAAGKVGAIHQIRWIPSHTQYRNDVYSGLGQEKDIYKTRHYAEIYEGGI